MSRDVRWCHYSRMYDTYVYLDMIAILHIEMYGGPKQVCLTLMILIS